MADTGLSSLGQAVPEISPFLPKLHLVFPFCVSSAKKFV